MVYCWNRYYDPTIGLWITRDPIGLSAELLIGHSGELGVSIRSYDYISSQKGTHGLIRRLKH
ncbi:hypothetical protein C0431_10265 [bacterium]|nr:hypothetical protein [bacterium]